MAKFLIEKDPPSFSAEFVCRSIKEVGEALDALENVGRAVFPTIVYRGEPGFEQAQAAGEANAEADRPKRKRRPMQLSGPPPAASFDAKVLEAIKAIGSADSGKVATALGNRPAPCGAAIARLRSRGMLTGDLA